MLYDYLNSSAKTAFTAVVSATGSILTTDLQVQYICAAIAALAGMVAIINGIDSIINRHK